ncbi:MAG: YggT family protein [Candidatus Actinomarinales bacterium]|nr:MAG: YggT family protein [Candidatus Actinomarinales bacterium]|tara:strand:- start:7184 stop:7453 length:270 start_codon:yes stop_codon:yes gene_type:complete
MCSLLELSYNLFRYSLFLWIILSWVQIPQEHPIGQIKSILDQFYNRILAPIRSVIPTVRIGMAGLDLSPIILILGVGFIYPMVFNFLCS